MVMEQDRRDKAPVPAEVWDLVAMEKEKVAVKNAVREKARDKVADKAKEKVKVTVAGKSKSKTARETSDLLSREETDAESLRLTSLRVQGTINDETTDCFSSRIGIQRPGGFGAGRRANPPTRQDYVC